MLYAVQQSKSEKREYPVDKAPLIGFARVIVAAMSTQSNAQHCQGKITILKGSRSHEFGVTDRGGIQMKSDPDDEPGIYLFNALIMFVAFIAIGVIAAGIMVHVTL